MKAVVTDVCGHSKEKVGKDRKGRITSRKSSERGHKQARGPDVGGAHL